MVWMEAYCVLQGAMFYEFKNEDVATLRTSHCCTSKRLHQLIIVTSQGIQVQVAVSSLHLESYKLATC